MMNTYISVDVGGTQIRVAVYPEAGIQPLRIKKVKTVGKGTPLERLIATIHEMWTETGSEDQVKAIGICVPGPVDYANGIITFCANLEGWENLPMRDILQQEFGVPVFIGNDANVAAIGEWKFGAGRGHKDVVYLTISTGIGGGVIVDERPMLGHQGLATELGHVHLEADSHYPCGCGQFGHLESFSSGTGIAYYANEQLELGRESSLQGKGKVTAKDVAEAAKAGDPLAVETFARASKYLAMGVVNYLHIFNPSAIIFGGGVASTGDLLLGPVKKMMPKLVYSQTYLEGLHFAQAELGDDVGLLGGLALIRMEME
ncbi:MAG: ROK family protein [Anaerolineae bacterium]|jgi:glucokinase|nr:ROK family protein [Anaerolineae bacterium]